MPEDPRTLEQRLVIGPGEVEYNEHSKWSGAKKTVEVSPYFEMTENEPRTIDPIEDAGASGALTLAAGCAYRIVSDGSLRFRLSIGASAAAATDIYLPADTPIVVKMGAYNSFNFIRTGGTFVQAVKVK